MIDAAAKTLMQKLIDNKIIESDDGDIYLYGLQMMISGIVKSMGFILIAWSLGWIMEALVFIATFSSLRIYAGGYHADTYIKCFVVTAMATFLSIFILKTFFAEDMLQYIIILMVAACSIILKYAPVDTPNKRMVGDERRKFRVKAIRNMLLQVLVITIILLLAPKWIFFCGISAMAMFFEAITLLPIFADN